MYYLLTLFNRLFCYCMFPLVNPRYRQHPKGLISVLRLGTHFNTPHDHASRGGDVLRLTPSLPIKTMGKKYLPLWQKALLETNERRRDACDVFKAPSSYMFVVHSNDISSSFISLHHHTKHMLVTQWHAYKKHCIWQTYHNAHISRTSTDVQ